MLEKLRSLFINWKTLFTDEVIKKWIERFHDSILKEAHKRIEKSIFLVLLKSLEVAKLVSEWQQLKLAEFKIPKLKLIII